MGDLIASQLTTSVPLLHRQFNAAIDWANSTYASAVASPLTITLGDEFQGVCERFEVGLQIIRDLRGRLLADGVQCRFVLGAAKLETPVNSANAWNMMGSGLAETRRRLNDKRDQNAYRFELQDEPELQSLLEAVGSGLTDIERAWTDRQRQVVLASRRSTASALAAQLGMSAQTLYKIRRAGHIDLYNRNWRALDMMMRRLDYAMDLTGRLDILLTNNSKSRQTSF